MIKKKLKKIAGLLLAAAFTTASLGACGKESKKSSAETEETTAKAVTQADSQDKTADDKTDGVTTEEPVEVRHLVIGTGGTGPAPYIFQDEKGNLQGYDIAVWEEIMRRLPQYTFEWNVTSDLFAAVDADYLDGVVQHLGINEERKQKYIFSDIYSVATAGVIVRDDWEGDTVTSYAAFAGLTCEATPSSYYATVFENWNEANPDEQVKIVYNENVDQWADHVADGTTDFYVFTKSVLQYLIKSKGLSGVKVIDYVPGDQKPEDIAASGTAFLFPKDEVQLREDVDAAFEAAVADGTIAKIAEEWLGSAEYAPTIDQVLQAREAQGLK